MTDVVRFRDSAGVEWEVREIQNPSLALLPPRLLRHPEFCAGWLMFQSADERRRLASHPANWQTLPTAELEQLCAQASPAVLKHRGWIAAPGTVPEPLTGPRQQERDHGWLTTQPVSTEESVGDGPQDSRGG